MRRNLACALLWPLVVLMVPATSAAQAPRDGQRDFDFEFGAWQTNVRIRARPLSGSSEWIELSGTTMVRPLLDGRANVAELKVKHATRSIEGGSLRLYNPQTRQWSIYYANGATGVLDKPVTGEFENGRGTFYAQDSYDGRAILVRFVIAALPNGAWQFEQAFSDDGGRTWEVNWLATDTRTH